MHTIAPELARIAPKLPDATSLPGITLEWLYSGQVPCFTLKDISRTTVDNWMGMLAQVLEHWPVDRPYVAIHDAATSGVMLTPYARAKIAELEDVNTALKGRVVVILPRTFVAQIIRVFVRTLRRQKVVTAVYFTRDEALKWITEIVPVHPA